MTFQDIERARERIGSRIVRTPVLDASHIRPGLRLKAELFQRTGSFKIRGALNKLLTMPEKERKAGLVSISAGNFAAALALGATEAGAHATIVMPKTAVRSKIEATQAYGGEVILTEGALMDACRSVQEERGLTFVHPFDDLDVMAGHGTIGLEILEDVPDVEAVVVPVGGGGLIGGIAAAIKAHAPHVKVYGVEPELADAMSRSLASGRVEHIDQPSSIADGLNAPFAGEHTLAAVQRYVDGVVRVSDSQIVDALRTIMMRAKLLAEPAGAAALAGLASGALSLPPDVRVVCVVSGGNADLDLLKRHLGPSSQSREIGR